MYPLAAVRLTNDGETGLPPGVITLYELDADGAASHVGDARLATLPVGERRLVSFAVDQKTRIDREVEQTQVIAGGSISKGVFHLTRIERQTTFYRLAAPADEARMVLIDHPRMPGWDLATPKESRVELTDTHYRIEIALEPGGEAELPVAVERTISQQIGLVSLPLTQLLRFAAEFGLTPSSRGRVRAAPESKRNELTEWLEGNNR